MSLFISLLFLRRYTLTLCAVCVIASSLFLMNQVKINARKRVVFLPKVCDVYRNDFGMGDCLVCLSQVLRYLDESSQLTIAALLENGGQIAVRFKQPSEKFHTSLTESLD